MTWFASFSREERANLFAPEFLAQVDPSHSAERRSLDPPAQRGDGDPRQYRAGSGAARGAPPRDFAPYHAAIARLLDARRAASRRTVLVAMHSFTPIFKGVRRRVEVGVLYNPDARDIRLQQILLELLRAEGDLAVGDNAPYAITGTSDYTVPAHAERRGLPHVEIEIRQDLIADQAGQSAWAARLARLLPLADRRLQERP